MNEFKMRRIELKWALPRLVVGMGLLLVAVQAGLAGLHLAGNLFRSLSQHSR